MLVAWKPWDGAASRIHLIDLSTSPHDLGEVPHSQTTSYTAVWTRDNRLWFTYDGSPDGDDKLWSYRAGESRSTPTDVPGAVLVEAVAAE
jgi:hypothetical protein